MVKLILSSLALITLVFFLIPFVSSETVQTLGNFKPNTNITLIQLGDNQSVSFAFCNITSVRKPDLSVAWNIW